MPVPYTAWLAAALVPVAAAILACAPRDAEHATRDGSHASRASVGEPVVPARGPGAVRLAIGGGLDGYLEPCGCAKAQLGGLARRVFHLQRARDDYDLILEGGNLVHAATQLDELKLVTTLEVFRFAPPAAIAIGPRDLELPLESLTGYLASFDFRFIASDLRPKEGIEWKVARHADVSLEARGRVRIAGLTMSLPDSAAERLELVEPARAWATAMKGVAEATLRIGIVHAGRDRVRELADSLEPRPDLLIGVTDQVPEPPSAADTSPERGVPVVWTGTRGRTLTSAWLRRDTEEPPVGRVTKYAVVRLAGSQTSKGAMEHRDAKAMIEQHRHMVAAMELREALAERVAPPIAGATYVGSVACAGCHAEAFTTWKNSRHGHAWETLEKAEKDPERYGWPVTRYPDCVGCHTVGYGERSGFVNPERTPLLRDVGCEECHGPGSKHIAAPDADRKRFIRRGGVAQCLQCHNQEQSPDFDYLEWWRKIEHK